MWSSVWGWGARDPLIQSLTLLLCLFLSPISLCLSLLPSTSFSMVLGIDLGLTLDSHSRTLPGLPPILGIFPSLAGHLSFLIVQNHRVRGC